MSSRSLASPLRCRPTVPSTWAPTTSCGMPASARSNETALRRAVRAVPVDVDDDLAVPGRPRSRPGERAVLAECCLQGATSSAGCRAGWPRACRARRRARCGGCRRPSAGWFVRSRVNVRVLPLCVGDDADVGADDHGSPAPGVEARRSCRSRPEDAAVSVRLDSRRRYVLLPSEDVGGADQVAEALADDRDLGAEHRLGRPVARGRHASWSSTSRSALRIWPKSWVGLSGLKLNALTGSKPERRRRDRRRGAEVVHRQGRRHRRGTHRSHVGHGGVERRVARGRHVTGQQRLGSVAEHGEDLVERRVAHVLEAQGEHVRGSPASRAVGAADRARAHRERAARGARCR